MALTSPPDSVLLRSFSQQWESFSLTWLFHPALNFSIIPYRLNEHTVAPTYCHLGRETGSPCGGLRPESAQDMEAGVGRIKKACPLQPEDKTQTEIKGSNQAFEPPLQRTSSRSLSETYPLSFSFLKQNDRSLGFGVFWFGLVLWVLFGLVFWAFFLLKT